MIRINLLPHRAVFRKQQIVEHIMVFAVAIFIAIFLVVVVDIVTMGELESLQEERMGLQTKNKTLAKKIGELRNLDSLRKDVEGKLAIVDELQAGRFRSLITFSAIAKAMPQNIWLSSIQNASETIRMSGFGESSQSVASFMRALENEPVFSGVQLVVDEGAKIEEVQVRKFSLTLHRLTLAEIEARQKGGTNHEPK